MKKRNNLFNNKYFFIILIFNLFFVMLPNIISDDNNELVIDVVDEVYEGEFFSVSVYDPNLENTSPYLVDVFIEFNGIYYNITENNDNGELILIAPNVSIDSLFLITASKNGYDTNSVYISVIKKENDFISKLFITPSFYTVDANKKFSVIVTDETGIPISGVTVGIENYYNEKSINITDENGQAFLFAPDKYNEIVILAQKDGYVDGSEKIWVDINPNFLDSFFQNPYIPIIFAFFVLVLAILFVKFRPNKLEKNIVMSDKSYKELNKFYKNNNQNLFKNNDKKLNNNTQNVKVRDISNENSKIEEIRINRSKSEKDIVTLDVDIRKNLNESTSSSNSNLSWFKGRDDIRYKIDKKTGVIDEKGKDKWFEGTDDIRKKIDEKLKIKGDKKK